jgi:predicted unusual protein kinase regulating ubiquinone biosynthesis (AarF/ABC1/UbiB family)
MHPGNILVRVVQPNNSNSNLLKSRPHVVFLDVGMTAELSSNDRVNLLEFFKAVARRDGRTAAESTLKLSKRQNCPNPEAFIAVNTLCLSLFICGGILVPPIFFPELISNFSTLVYCLY